jgi:hypothetical protein
MPVVPGFRSKWFRWVYDTVGFAHTTAIGTLVQFFTQQIGSGTSPTAGAGTKQIQDTNLTEARKLPFVGGDMWVQTLRLVIGGLTGLPTPNDVFKLFKGYTLAFLVNNDEYMRGPLDCFPAGGGAFINGGLSTAQMALTTPTYGGANGLPSCTAALDLPIPIGIGQGETFEVQLNGATQTTDAAGGTTLGQGLLLRVILGGEIGQAANQ